MCVGFSRFGKKAACPGAHRPDAETFLGPLSATMSPGRHEPCGPEHMHHRPIQWNRARDPCAPGQSHRRLSPGRRGFPARVSPCGAMRSSLATDPGAVRAILAHLGGPAPPPSHHPRPADADAGHARARCGPRLLSWRDRADACKNTRTRCHRGPAATPGRLGSRRSGQGKTC